MPPTRRNAIALSTLLLALACASACAADYTVDTVHTQVFACASHLGFSTPCARFRVKSGFFHFDDDHWNEAKVDVVIDTKSADLGDAAWNATVRSWQFLDAGKYPQAHFVSKAVQQIGAHNGVVHGTLTLRGVSRALDLVATFHRAGPDPYNFRYTVGFSATATFKRSDFGMQKYLPDVGDAVSIRIEAEGLRDKHAQAQSERTNQGS
jgi:polyisoprenoid-binding protein YceI